MVVFVSILESLFFHDQLHVIDRFNVNSIVRQPDPRVDYFRRNRPQV